MTKRDLPALSIVEASGIFSGGGKFRQREVLQALEERINAVDPEIGAYLVHDFAAAMTEAEKADVSLPLGRDSDRNQGYDQRRRPAMHLCFEDLARLSRAL